jgi:hypothetical protein
MESHANCLQSSLNFGVIRTANSQITAWAEFKLTHLICLPSARICMYQAKSDAEPVQVMPELIPLPERPMSLYEGLAGAICFWADLLAPEQSHFPGYELPPHLRTLRSSSSPDDAPGTSAQPGAAKFSRSASAAALGRSGSGAAAAAGAPGAKAHVGAGAALAGAAAAKGRGYGGSSAGPALVRNRSGLSRNGSAPRGGADLPTVLRHQNSTDGHHLIGSHAQPGNSAEISSQSGQHAGLSSAGDWISGASGHSSGRGDPARPSSAGVAHARAPAGSGGSRSSRRAEGPMVAGPSRGSTGGGSVSHRSHSRGGDGAATSHTRRSVSRQGSGAGGHELIGDRFGATRPDGMARGAAGSVSGTRARAGR